MKYLILPTNKIKHKLNIKMGDLNLDVSSQYFWETTYKDSPKNYIT